MAYGTKKNRRRTRIRAAEGELIVSSLESTKGAISKLQIVGDKLFKKMEAWTERKEEEKGKGNIVCPPYPSSSLLTKNLFRYDIYSPRENIITWEGLNRAQKKEVVNKFLEEEAETVEERSQNFGAWLTDQASWTRKIIRRLREEGPFFPAGSLLKWPSRHASFSGTAAQQLVDRYNPGLFPVFLEETWEKTVKQIKTGDFDWDIKKLRSPYQTPSSWSWYPYKNYIIEDSPFLSLGEWIIMGETKEDFFFIRAAKFLAPVVTGDVVNDIFRLWASQAATNSNLSSSSSSTAANVKKKKIKQTFLTQQAKTKPVFVLWNAFSGMSKLPGVGGQCGDRSPAKGFPAIIKSPAQLPKEGGLKFIFPTEDANNNNQHELLMRINSLTAGRGKDNSSFSPLKEDLVNYCKDFLLSLDKEVVESWRRDSGDRSSSSFSSSFTVPAPSQ